MGINKKVLIIVYDFPPNIGGGRVMRTVKFAKYLPEFGWEPIVLTVKRYDYYMKDSSLLKELKGTKIYYAFDPIFSHIRAWRDFLFKKAKTKIFPSVGIRKNSFVSQLIKNHLGWYLPALIYGIYICLANRIKVIYSTSPPHTPHLVALSLHNLLGIPWVCDFRDAWADNPIYEFSEFIFLKKIAFFFEKCVIKSAKHIICSTKAISNGFEKRYASSNISIIYNGYDEDDFKDLKGMKFNKFTIVYVGGIGAKRSLSPILRALENLEVYVLKQIQLLLIGKVAEDTLFDIENSNVRNVVNIIPYIQHKKVLEYIVTGDVLLVVLMPDEDGMRAIPAKVFEYLRAGKPILAVCSKMSELWILVSSFEGNICVEPYDADGIKIAIKSLFMYKSNVLFNQERVRKFERKEGTHILAGIFSQNDNN